jgi:hypothetical protein
MEMVKYKFTAYPNGDQEVEQVLIGKHDYVVQEFKDYLAKRGYSSADIDEMRITIVDLNKVS